MYNWLLGWVLLHASSTVRENYREINRAAGLGCEGALQSTSSSGIRGRTVSLLHDVGYLFEGSIAVMNPLTQNDQALVGIHVLDDYYNARLSAQLNIGSAHHQRELFKELDFSPPDLRRELSIARIARSTAQSSRSSACHGFRVK